ncbi:monooxygenase [Aspergillus insuetus]
MAEPFKVIIVGGSIAGLTLAHCLHRANIKYIVLERKAEIAPQEGASIALWPTGGQVLDQLGLWEDVSAGADAIKQHNVLFPDGFAFTHFVLERIYERFGYGFLMVERQRLLECLYQNLPDKTKIHVSKAVVEIQQTDTGVSVTTQDGTIYTGSLVVGADGVHSRVRSEMWRLAEAEGQYPGSSPPITASEKETLRAEYSCVFGISTPIPGLRGSEHDLVYGDGYVVLSFHNRESVYWFVVHRMDREYAYQDVPRFTAEDAEDMCMRKYGDVRIADGVYVRHLWEYKKAASMIAMEQGMFETWGSGRIVLIGDAVRKMTVTLGQGANATIEDSAVLATLLDRLVHETRAKPHQTPTNEDIKALFAGFREARYARSHMIYNETRLAVQFQTRKGFIKRVIGRYIMPYMIKPMADGLSKLIAGGPVIGFLPLPARRMDGWEKYGSRNASKRGDAIPRQPMRRE